MQEKRKINDHNSDHCRVNTNEKRIMQSSSECKNDLISELNLEIEKEKTNEETILYEKKKEALSIGEWYLDFVSSLKKQLLEDFQETNKVGQIY